MKKEREEKLDLQLQLKNNCCQAVLGSFCEEYGLSTETAMLLAGGLGGGMCNGEKCGAAVGMFLVAGLEYGPFDGTDLQKKNELKEIVRRLNSRFEETFGVSNCKDLMRNLAQKKYDLPQEERYQKRPCALLMETAGNLLEEELHI